MSKRWVIPESVSEEVKAKFPEYGGVLLQLLWNRGLRTQEEMDVFLGPDWSRDTFDPFLFKNMQEAVDRVFAGLEAGEVVTVHGDYDADGTCGTAVLVSTLRDLCRKFGYDESLVTYYIPHREKEGYGVAVATVDLLQKEWDTKLIITVDCGISNKEAIDHAKTLGIDTIVCDHHAMPKELPEQAILIHPLVPGETFPNKHLCGTAVAFKLASGLIVEARKRGAELPEGYEKWLLDLVAIATITDVMQLTGENRVLEKYGLLVLNKTRRIGLKKLLEVSGAKLGELDTTSIGFVIGPRINAAGRMEHAHEALKLLIAEDELEATTQAMRLHDINKERQRVSRQAYKEAKQQLGEVTDEKILIASNPEWRAGVVGLVAGRICNDYSLPVFIVHQHEDKFMGSGRSVEGFDVTKALHHASEFLDKYGGHPQACGFSTYGEVKFEKAVEKMREYAQEHMTEELSTPTVNLDAEVDLADVSWELHDAIEKLKPFGPGNPTPLFAAKGVKVVSFSTVGKEGAHLRLRLQSETGKIINAIAFGFGDRAEDLSLGAMIDVLFEVNVNEWNGNRELQLRLEDLKI